MPRASQLSSTGPLSLSLPCLSALRSSALLSPVLTPFASPSPSGGASSTAACPPSTSTSSGQHRAQPAAASSSSATRRRCGRCGSSPRTFQTRLSRSCAPPPAVPTSQRHHRSDRCCSHCRPQLPGAGALLSLDELLSLLRARSWAARPQQPAATQPATTLELKYHTRPEWPAMLAALYGAVARSGLADQLGAAAAQTVGVTAPPPHPHTSRAQASSPRGARARRRTALRSGQQRRACPSSGYCGTSVRDATARGGRTPTCPPWTPTRRCTTGVCVPWPTEPGHTGPQSRATAPRRRRRRGPRTHRPRSSAPLQVERERQAARL